MIRNHGGLVATCAYQDVCSNLSIQYGAQAYEKYVLEYNLVMVSLFDKNDIGKYKDELDSYHACAS
jgi:hypothetical protein